MVSEGIYLLSPFNLTSNIDLHLEENSVLLASTDIENWPLAAGYPSYPDEV